MAEGKPVAKYKWETAYGVNTATPIVSAEEIFISSGYGRGCSLVSLEGESLKKVWENKEMNNHCQTCVLAEGCPLRRARPAEQERQLKCLDFATARSSGTRKAWRWAAA